MTGARRAPESAGIAPPSVPRRPADARHSVEFYGAPGSTPLRPGDRMFLRCDGGPCLSRLETFPPRMEIRERHGLYVLVDDGPIDDWSYQFVADLGH